MIWKYNTYERNSLLQKQIILPELFLPLLKDIFCNILWCPSLFTF